MAKKTKKKAKRAKARQERKAKKVNDLMVMYFDGLEDVNQSSYYRIRMALDDAFDAGIPEGSMSVL